MLNALLGSLIRILEQGRIIVHKLIKQDVNKKMKDRKAKGYRKKKRSNLLSQTVNNNYELTMWLRGKALAHKGIEIAANVKL